MSRSVSMRRRQPEWMDQPDLDPILHAGALRGLARINFWSGSSRILWPSIRAEARAASQPLRVLDLASGGGDIVIRLWHKARRAGLSLHLQGCDRSPTAVAYAQDQARSRGAAVGFFVHDVLELPLPDGYDLMINSLFLHHLEQSQAVDLLRRMALAAGRMILINDLVRGPFGLALAYLGTRLLSGSAVVHKDGPLSVAGAFTAAEMVGLAETAGLKNAAVTRHWPFRMLLRWTKEAC